MATLRSGRKVDANGNSQKTEEPVEEDNSKDKSPKDNTSVIVFVGLLIDLLGKKSNPYYCILIPLLLQPSP